MTTLTNDQKQQIERASDMFLLACKECGFTKPEQIEEHFETIALVALGMVKESRERVVSKIASNPIWMQYLAARYQNRVYA